MATVPGREHLPGGIVRPVTITHIPHAPPAPAPARTTPPTASPPVTPQRQPGTREGDAWWETDAGKQQALDYYAQQRPQYQRYETSGGYYWGVTPTGMMERLNPVDKGVGPNPYAAASGPGVGAKPTAFTQPAPTPPPAGSSKARIRAYAESQASWERARLWASMPADMSYTERQDAIAPYANQLLPGMRESDIYQSLLRPGGSKERSLLQQYAQQQGNIVSSSGTLVPLQGGGYGNITTGEVFVPDSMARVEQAAGASKPTPSTPSTSPFAGGIIGAIAREQFGMDYVTGGKPLIGAGAGAGASADPFKGLSRAATGAISAITTSPFVKALSEVPGPIQPIAKLGGTVWSAGEYIGLDRLIKTKTDEYNKGYKQLESQGLIVGTEFRGTESQFTQLDTQYQQISALGAMRSSALDRALGINVAQAQAATARTGPAVQYGERFTFWINQNVLDPMTERLGYTESLYTSPTGFMERKGLPDNQIVRSFMAPLEVAGAFGIGVVRGIASVPPLMTQIPYAVESYAKYPQAIPGGVVLGGYMMAEGMYEGFTTRPVVFAGELYGASKGLSIAGKGFSRVTGFGAGISTVPTGRVQRIISYEGGRPVTTERPITFSMGGLYWRNPLEFPIFGRTETLSARPLIGATWGEPIGRVTPFVGRHIVPPETPIGTGYLPMTPADWAFVRPTMEARLGGADPFMQHIFSETFAARRVGYAMKGSSQPRLEEEWGQVAPRTIPEPAWREVTEYIRQNRGDMVVYGSTTARAHLGRYGRFSLGDLDIDIRPSVAEVHSRNIYDIIRRHEPRIGELRHETSMITGDAGRYTARLPSGEIVLDLHPYWEPKWNLPGRRSGLTESGGVRMMPLARTVWGKTMFFLQYREVAPGRAIIEPYSGRFKDPADISLIMGKYPRDLATEPLTWDVMGLRTARRLRLAQESVRVSRSFDEYTRRYASEGIPLITEARDPLRGIDLAWAPEARYNIELGMTTKLVRTQERPSYQPSPTIKLPTYKYPTSPMAVSPTIKPSPLFGPTPTTGIYPSPATMLFEPSPSFTGQKTTYPSYRSFGKYIGKYPVVSYPQYFTGKYGTTPRYPTSPKYPSVDKYVGTTPKYPSPSRYPASPKYPSVPKQPVYPGYPTTGKPPQYPTTQYIGRTTPPTTTQYPGVNVKVPEYPGLVVKPTSQKYPSVVPPPPPRTPPTTPPKFPPLPPIYPPSPSVVFPPTRRLTYMFKEETPPKPPKLRLHFDVLASKWNIINPIPRPGGAGVYPGDVLKISNKQYSRKKLVYVKSLPFEQFAKIDVKVKKVI